MSSNAPLLPAVEKLRDALSASEALVEMKDLENEELSEELKVAHACSKSWYDRAMKAEATRDLLESRAWQAEAALADCERELADNKELADLAAEQAQFAIEHATAKEAELRSYVTHAAFGKMGALIADLHDLRQSYDLLHLAHHGVGAGVAEAVSALPNNATPSRNNSPVSPLHLPWKMSSVEGTMELIPGAPAPVKAYSFGQMIEALRQLHPEPVAPMPTRTASSSSA